MWVRKTEEDKKCDEQKAAARRKKVIEQPVLWAFIVAILFATLYVFGGLRGALHPPVGPMSLEEAKTQIPLQFIINFLIFFPLFAFITRKGASENDSAMICPDCKHAQHPGKERCDRCGGALEPLKNWRWKDDE
ncbi:hypothetical protein [Ereboglobus luteus]|uniref:Uncharacterized protein n=1 Tax=Ereboglobus luteus TaxID=1796921 RepID=A0A2U8E505_9BACT|nr:hypothetical protein [Ereboglobus luteus]AWI09602.1 hypothetical protein CKA38_10410 [Ereboglobus luteus]